MGVVPPPIHGKRHHGRYVNHSEIILEICASFFSNYVSAKYFYKWMTGNTDTGGPTGRWRHPPLGRRHKLLHNSMRVISSCDFLIQHSRKQPHTHTCTHAHTCTHTKRERCRSYCIVCDKLMMILRNTDCLEKIVLKDIMDCNTKET